MLRRSVRVILAVGAATFPLTVSSLAHADGHDVARSDTPSGYAYRFTDDQLAGGFLDAQGGRIHAIRHAERDALLRPRMSFVPELLKSVENL
jgi:hypothetical protein